MNQRKTDSPLRGNREDEEKLFREKASSLHARVLANHQLLAKGSLWTAVRVCVFGASVTGLMTFGCGTRAANLVISAPSTAIAGSPFSITVTAMVGGSRDKVINSLVHFTSSDSAAVLPGDFYFVAADAGSRTFTNGVALMTLGSKSITATVVQSPSINGTVSVTVSSPRP